MHEKEVLLLLKRYGVKVSEDTSLDSLGDTHFLISVLCLVIVEVKTKTKKTRPRVEVEQFF